MPENGKRLLYFGYSYDMSEQSVRVLFTLRFGYPPIAVFKDVSGDWWAGPAVDSCHSEPSSGEESPTQFSEGKP